MWKKSSKDKKIKTEANLDDLKQGVKISSPTANNIVIYSCHSYCWRQRRHKRNISPVLKLLIMYSSLSFLALRLFTARSTVNKLQVFNIMFDICLLLYNSVILFWIEWVIQHDVVWFFIYYYIYCWC